ncbi:hypothetical protein [Catenulispora subtropica]|uniref:Lipoprotein n=1 Tax=Catenulispora subtropica TaxID=450798 RepID=A0ABP5D7A2_9ACTN
MTARRSSATERRGVGGITPRPAALSAAVLAVALAGSGCASRNANTTGMAAPFNQDTGAPAKDGGLPHTPPAAAARQAVLPTITALPSTTNVLPPGTTDVPTTETNQGDTIAAKFIPGQLTVGLTPEQNPAAPKPVLEVVGMPTWLWLEGVPPALQTTITPVAGGPSHVVIDRAVIDKVAWTTDVPGGPAFTCGNGTASPSPGKGYGIPYDIAFDPTASDAPNACVNTFTAPFYVKGGGPVAAGVYNLKATVTWHIECTVDGAAPTLLAGAKYAGTVDTASTPIRVGEIQALATSP